MQPSAFRIAVVVGAALAAAGCGIVLGLEDHGLGGGTDATVRDDSATPPAEDVAVFDATTDTTDAAEPPTDGGVSDAPDITTLASGQVEPRGIAVDTTHVYWADKLGGSVRRVEKSGGSVDLFGTDAGAPVRVALDDTYAYWSGSNGACVGRGIWRKPKAGGAPTALYSEVSPGALRCPSLTPSLIQVQDLAVNSTSVYWTAQANINGGNSLYRIPSSGIPTAPVSTPLSTGTNAYVALSGDNVFFSDAHLVKRPADAGASTIGTTGAGWVSAVVASPEHVYFAAAVVLRVPIGGGAPEQVGPAFPQRILTMTVTASDLFLVIQGDPSIVRINLATRALTTILEGEPATSAAVDDSTIYWTSTLGYIRKRPLPP